MDTSFTRLVGCAVPIQQAGMGGTATVALAAAVSNAGALGMLGMPTAPPELVRDHLDALGRQTSGPFGINFLMPFVRQEAVAAAAGRARVVEFFYGDPDAGLIELVHRGGSLASWQVGSAAEAEAAADAGCDLVVAQGVEAGGHVRGTTALLPLLDAVLDRVRIPVLAAGGIATARSVAAVLAAGAAGARVGTRFVATDEADTHPAYLAALLQADADDTVLTTAFSVMWPDAPHRVLASCVTAAEGLEGDIAGEMATESGARLPLPRFAPPAPGRTTTGHIEAMALYAGQSVGAVRRREPAAAVVSELAEGAERLLRGAGG